MNHTEMEPSHPQSSAPTTFAVMSENSHEEVIHQINKAQTELKIRLEQVSKLRIDCVKMQLNLLQLYKPQCLEILEMLRDISTPPEESCTVNDDDEVESCNNETFILATSMRRGIATDYEAELPYEVHGSFLNQEIMTDSTDTVLQAMELQENAPVFYSSATIITMQPEAGSSRNARRPIPVNTLDWISTPRAQLNSITGTQFLAGVEQLEIQQVIDLSTLLGTTDRGNQYRVKVPRAETLFLVMEARHETTSRLCGWYKGFVLNVLDQCGETAFVIRKDPSWMHVPGSRQRITVESANLIGSVEENFSVIGPKFTVYDASKTPLCKIYGPNICGCCMYKEALFQVVSMDETHQLASLIHHWDHLNVDYILQLTFPIDTDVKLKSLLLGASFLLEYLYFHRIRRASRR